MDEAVGGFGVGLVTKRGMPWGKTDAELVHGQGRRPFSTTDVSDEHRKVAYA